VQDLNPTTISIIVPGTDKYLLSEKVEVCGLAKFLNQA